MIILEDVVSGALELNYVILREFKAKTHSLYNAVQQHLKLQTSTSL